MRRLLTIVVFALIFNFNCVFAMNHDSNVVGTTVVPSQGSSASDKSCPTGAYYLGGQGKNSDGTPNFLLGLRVTFFDKNGNQLGNTVDVWNKNKVYSNKTWGLVSGEDDNAKLASANGFEYYSININHAHGLPSRLDYYRGDVAFTLSGGIYYYYFDKTATGNQLMYVADSAQAMKEYLTDASVVQRYMNIAKVTGIDSKDPDYTMVIEVLVRVEACGKGIYGGIYTVSDFGSLVRNNKYINNFNLRCHVVKYLSLEADADIGNITFIKTDLSQKKCGYPEGNYTPDEVTTSNWGVGMGFIHGYDVWKERNYKIVYRSIDLKNPFVNLNGEQRELAITSNWYGKEDTIDANVYEGEPKYTVVLTPTKIKEIREDSKKTDYIKIIEKYSASDTFANSEFKKKFGL